MEAKAQRSDEERTSLRADVCTRLPALLLRVRKLGDPVVVKSVRSKYA
jgi:hypothetical protein